MLHAIIDDITPGFNGEDLIVAAREGLKIPISSALTDDYGAIPAVAIAPQLEDEMLKALNDPEETTRTWAVTTFGDFLKDRYMSHQSSMPILLCQPRLASSLRTLFQNEPKGFFPIFTPKELTTDAPIEIIEIFGADSAHNTDADAS